MCDNQHHVDPGAGGSLEVDQTESVDMFDTQYSSEPIISSHPGQPQFLCEGAGSDPNLDGAIPSTTEINEMLVAYNHSSTDSETIPPTNLTLLTHSSNSITDSINIQTNSTMPSQEWLPLPANRTNTYKCRSHLN